jgi:hypothetical protein
MLAEEECFQVGREIAQQHHCGELVALNNVHDIPAELRIVDEPGFDIFGQPLDKEYKFEGNCPSCGITVEACGLATHIENCMGIVRRSSRIANNRVKGKNGNCSSSSSAGSDGSGSTVQGAEGRAGSSQSKVRRITDDLPFCNS